MNAMPERHPRPGMAFPLAASPPPRLAAIGSPAGRGGARPALCLAFAPLLVAPAAWSRLDMIRLGLLIPQFPSQTHIAMWRVGNAMRELGADVRFVSTRRPDASERCHQVLEAESARTFYAWPASAGALLRGLGLSNRRAAGGVAYLAGLRESTVRERASLAPLLLSALNLRAWAARERIEHIFVHSCANAAHLVALCHRLGGPPYSLRLGGDIEVYGKDQASKMRRASFILAAARVNLDQIREQVGLPEDRLLWSWLGVDTRRFRPRDESSSTATPNALPATAGEPIPPTDRPFRAVSIGRLHVAKGHAHALRAMQTLVAEGLNLHYTIGGSGPHEAALRTLVTDLGLTHRVRFVGALDENQVLSALQAADVFLLPSVGRGEASPVAVIEAMACGLPVIASTIGGTPDMITDGADGCLTPMGDEAAIAAAWRRLATDPALHRRLADAARRRAVAQFDCLQVGRRVLERICGHPLTEAPRLDERGSAADGPEPTPQAVATPHLPEVIAETGPGPDGGERAAIAAAAPGGQGTNRAKWA